MKKLYFLFLIFPSLFFAQINGVVVDENNNPLFYANIWNKDQSAGATSNIEGKFLVEKATTKDELVISMAGFQTRIVNAVENDTIILNFDWEPEGGLLVYPEKTLRHQLGESHMQNFFFSPGNAPWIFAKYFKNDVPNKNIKYIDKVIVFTKSNVADATFKLRLIKPNENGEPGSDLITEPIIVHVKRGNKKNTVDLLQYNVKIPKEGIFIGFEWILSDNNQIKAFNFFKDEEVFSDYKYAPDLVCNEVKKSNAYRYIAGEWKKNETFITTKDKNESRPLIEPAINLILTN